MHNQHSGGFPVNLRIIFLINQLVVWSKKCQQNVISEDKLEVLKSLTQKYSVYVHRAVRKPETWLSKWLQINLLVDI